MTREEAVAAVLHEMDSIDLPTPKPGKFVDDWRFTVDAWMDSLDAAELILVIEGEHNVIIPLDEQMTTVGELADLLVKAKA